MRHSLVAKKSLMNPSQYFFSYRTRNFVTPIIESVRTPARIRPYPTGRLFWVAVPGTSCQATIAPSLRDKSRSPIEKPYNYLSVYGVEIVG
jgi:hypothetical protein